VKKAEGNVGRMASEQNDVRRAILELASTPVRMLCPDGKRRIISLFAARLIELASPRCRRRLMCEDFIALVMMAARMAPEEVNCITRV
jgi:hypothetical protein